jgi:hypothetical protein
VPNENKAPEICELTKVIPLQLSAAVGGVQVATAWHEVLADTTISEVTQVEKTGFTSSTTVTLNVHVATFPATSVAVYFTTVIPRWNIDPEACVEFKVTAVQLSVAMGAVQFTVVWHAADADTVILEGHPAITGAVLSVTTTLNVQVDIFPAASVAVYFTWVVPIGNVLPGACVETRVTEPQLSDAVGGVQFATP